MGEAVTVSVENGIAIVTIANPPVNALGHSVRSGLDKAADRIDSDVDIVNSSRTPTSRSMHGPSRRARRRQRCQDKQEPDDSHRADIFAPFLLV